jgi:hypothetical protein
LFVNVGGGSVYFNIYKNRVVSVKSLCSRRGPGSSDVPYGGIRRDSVRTDIGSKLGVGANSASVASDKYVDTDVANVVGGSVGVHVADCLCG